MQRPVYEKCAFVGLLFVNEDMLVFTCLGIFVKRTNMFLIPSASSV